jgi:hypothetical protein
MFRSLAWIVALVGCSAGAAGTPDAGEPLTPDVALVPDAATTSSVSACEVDSMSTVYSGFLPPNPYATGPAAPACVVGRHDAIVVLGCPSNDDGTASSCQIARADLAVKLAGAGLGDRFIVTGGAVHNAYVEAEALHTLLLQRAVADAAIRVEPLAAHTDENIYYSDRIMEGEGWQNALVVSDDPGHLIMTAVCDANCCVERGRLTIFDLHVGADTIKVGHYVRYPWATTVSDGECEQIEQPTKLMCTNLGTRHACADHFQL